MMVATEMLALSWCMFNGIVHLTIYQANVQSERFYLETAATLEATNEAGPASEFRREAEKLTQMNRETWSHVVTLCSLVGVGMVLGGLGLAFRIGRRWSGSATSKMVGELARVCCTGAVIVLASLILAGILFIGCMLVMRILDE
jgi:hypothetical protein